MAAPRTVGAVVAGMLALAGCSNEEPYALSSEITPVSEAPETLAPAPSPTAEQSQADGEQFNEAETVAIENAKNAVTRFYEVSDAAFGDPGNAGEKPFHDVAINPVSSETLGMLGYARKNELHQTGRITVKFSGVRSVRTKSAPEEFIYPEVFLDVCVDQSKTDLIDPSGESAQEAAPGQEPAIIGVYEEPGEGWLVQHLEYMYEKGTACDQR